MALESFEKKTFRTNGVNLNCLFKGKGEPVILLHGYPQCNLIWHKVAGKLSEKFSVLAPDLRGYGESDKPDASNEDHSIYCKRTTGQDIAELADILGFDKFHLVGHDRGARVGHRMALDFPDRILSLVSLDVMPLTKPRLKRPLSVKQMHVFKNSKTSASLNCAKKLENIRRN